MVLFVSVVESVLEGDPEIEEAETRDEAAHIAVEGDGSDDWIVDEDGVLIPEEPSPWGIAESDAEIEAEQDAKKEFAAFKPTGNLTGGLFTQGPGAFEGHETGLRLES